MKEAVVENMDVNENQFLTFMLNGEEYGVDILKVQELRSWESVTPIPNTPPYVCGVINLRGVVVPIIDLRTRFGIEGIEPGPTTVVVIVKLDSADGKERVMGLVTDAVSEVYSIGETDLQPAPEMEGSVAIDFVKELATIGNKMVILLDINRLVNEGILGETPSSVALEE